MTIADRDESKRLLSLTEMAELPAKERMVHELRIMEGLMAQAVRKEKWLDALKILESARPLMNRISAK